MKKRPFRCEKCDSEITIYKKGKGHRVLICPNCGILATNPGAVGKVLKRVGKGVLGEIPGASLIMEGGGLARDLTRRERAGEKATAEASPPLKKQRTRSSNLDLYKYALGGR